MGKKKKSKEEQMEKKQADSEDFLFSFRSLSFFSRNSPFPRTRPLSLCLGVGGLDVVLQIRNQSIALTLPATDILRRRSTGERPASTALLPSSFPLLAGRGRGPHRSPPPPSPPRLCLPPPVARPLSPAVLSQTPAISQRPRAEDRQRPRRRPLKEALERERKISGMGSSVFFSFTLPFFFFFSSIALEREGEGKRFACLLAASCLELSASVVSAASSPPAAEANQSKTATSDGAVWRRSFFDVCGLVVERRGDRPHRRVPAPGRRGQGRPGKGGISACSASPSVPCPLSS